MMHEWLSVLKCLERGPLVVKYERLCLHPVYEMRRIMDYLDAPHCKEPQQIMDYPDRVKDDPAREAFRHVQRDPVASYQRHCLKWQRDPIFTERDNRLICSFLKREMEFFGYLKDGHSEAFFIE